MRRSVLVLAAAAGLAVMPGIALAGPHGGGHGGGDRGGRHGGGWQGKGGWPGGQDGREARPGSEQGQVRREMREGNVQSLRDIERRVLPTMKGMQYLGPEYDPVAMAYRLKFIQDGRVVFVDVDARSGRIIGESR